MGFWCITGNAFMGLVAALIYCRVASIILLAASRLFDEVVYAAVDYVLLNLISVTPLRIQWQVLLFWKFSKKTNKQAPWSESASELYRPSDRLLSAKWLPTCADRGCHVVSVTDLYGRILGFLDRSRSSVVLTKLSGPSPDSTTFILVVPGIEPGPPDL
jgi:hypothetical protein